MISQDGGTTVAIVICTPLVVQGVVSTTTRSLLRKKKSLHDLLALEMAGQVSLYGCLWGAISWVDGRVAT